MNQPLPAPWRALAASPPGTPAALDRLQLAVRRNDGELWLDYRLRGDGDTAAQTAPFEPDTSVRFLLDPTDPLPELTPLLADRAVVSRPLVSTELPPRHTTTLLISTPLWAGLHCNGQTLAELPTVRLSDTWFGPNTRIGELCYASQTRARLHLENAADNPFRALTPVTITNSGDDNLRLDRVNVPVTHLGLYWDGQRFWTSAIRITRELNLANARVHIEEQPPQLSRGARRLAEPRRPIRGGVLERAVDLLFA